MSDGSPGPAGPAGPGGLSTAADAFAAAVQAQQEQAAQEQRERDAALATGPPVAGTVSAPATPAGDPSLRSAFAVAGRAPLAVLALINGCDYAVSGALAALAPDVERSLHLSDAAFLTTVSLTGLCFALAAVPVGLLSDRTSRPRVTGGLTVVAGASTVLASAAASGLAFGGARLVTGAAQSAIQSTHLPLLADSYPERSRPRVYAVHSLAPSLGTLLGALLGGGLAALVGGGAGWRWPVTALGVVSAVLGLLALRLPEPRDTGGAGRAAGTDRGGPRAALGPSLARLSRIRSLTAVLGALAVLGATLIAAPSLFSLYLERVQHLGSGGRGLVLGVVGLGSIAGLLAGARAGEQVLLGRPDRTVRLLAVSLVLYAVLLSAALRLTSLTAVTALATVASTCSSLGIVPLYTTITAVVPDRLRSLAFALVGVVVVVCGGLVGSLVGGALSDDHGPVTALTAVLLVSTPLAALLVLRAGSLIGPDLAAAAADAVAQAQPAPADDGAPVPVLEVRGLAVSLGGRRVLSGVDLVVREGEVLAVVGTNGAGKSTLLRALSGLLAVDAGSVRLDGRDITQAGTAARVAAGLVQVSGGRALFPDLTVAENLLAGAHLFAWDRERVAAETARVLDLFPVLGARLGQRAGSLSGGEQQLLGLAKALLLRPRVLLVDELTLGLSPAAVAELLDVTARLREEGTTLVVVEQSLTTALGLADRAVFLERGQVRFTGAPADLLVRDDLARAVFLGGGSGG